jgi:DNA-binding protein HU-beta
MINFFFHPFKDFNSLFLGLKGIDSYLFSLNRYKVELIDKMAEDAEISKAAASTALQSFLECVTDTLKKKDGKVALTGFGTFSKTHRNARTGRNPQTGEPIEIKACNVVKFKAGKALRDAIA